MKRVIIPYNPELKSKARELRNRSTTTEIILWKHLKGRQIRGYDFHRQKPVGEYIVDFFCCELNLAIENDGLSHIGREKYDSFRQAELEKQGVKFLRFKDDEVFYNVSKVICDIEKWIEVNR